MSPSVLPLSSNWKLGSLLPTGDCLLSYVCEGSPVVDLLSGYAMFSDIVKFKEDWSLHRNLYRKFIFTVCRVSVVMSGGVLTSISHPR